MERPESAGSLNRNKLLLAAGWASVMLFAVFAYWPGLAGPWLFDDFGSIKPLGDYGGVVDWYSFKAFVFGGHAGPTGRPLALLSFLIDANDWPADSWPFKRTNLVIHLLAGVTLGVLVTLVLKCVRVRQRDARWIALVVTAAWILHPFLVSTTLYIVQRMAQLSALFMFAGLALYLRGRLQTTGGSYRGYLTMSAAIGVFTLLAMLSKENGILLPLLVGVVELTVVASQRDRLPALNRYWSTVFIAAPSAVIFLYLGKIVLLSNFFEITPNRDFSLYERLLTQGRVLVEYLQHWYLPKLYTTGVFQDHFIKSTGLFTPMTTVLSVLFHTAVIAFAFVKRRELPLVALAVLFFYASHLLESTVVNLELYFEHRNYVAAAFLLLPLVEVARRRMTTRGFLLASLVAVALLGSFTRYSATVWQSLPSMIESSALKAPTSARAQGQYAKLLFIAGREDEALSVIDRAIDNIPTDDPLLLTIKLHFLCATDSLDSDEFDRLTSRLSGLLFDPRALKAYNVMMQEFVTGSCPNIEIARLEGAFRNMLQVPINDDPASLQYAQINWLIGYTRIHMDQPQAALEAFSHSLQARGGASRAMAMAAVMATNGYNSEALVLANRALETLRDGLVEDSKLVQKVREEDILEFIQTVETDLAAEPAGGNSGPAG